MEPIAASQTTAHTHRHNASEEIEVPVSPDIRTLEEDTEYKLFLKDEAERQAQKDAKEREETAKVLSGREGNTEYLNALRVIDAAINSAAT